MDKNNYINESDLLYNGTCGFYHLEKGAFHYHRQVEILYVEKGTLTVYTVNGEFPLRKNQFAVIRPYEPHTFGGSWDNRCVSPILPDQYSNQLAQISIDNCVVDDPGGDALRIFKMYPQFNRLSPEHRMFYFQMIFSLLEECLLESGDGDSRRERAVFEYIRRNCTRPLTLEQVAAACGTNRSAVSKLINTRTHMNFPTYLNRVRLSLFIDRYQKEPGNITRTAEEAGFESPRTFYRAFKAEYGMTPKQYFGLLLRKAP